MGARTNFTFRTSTGDLTLYSHWGGDSKYEDLAVAIHAARSRWQDPSYALRIIISQLVGESWNSETGFGLYVGSEGGEESYDYVIVDMTNNTVTFDSVPYLSQSFEDYVAHHSTLQVKK